MGHIRQRECKRMHLRRVLTAVFAVGFVLSFFSTVGAFAAANLFKIQNAELTELSPTAEGDIVSFDETSIVSNVVFHKLNDTAKYAITFKNTDSADHVIESITDNNENPYVVYEYDSHADENIAAGDTFVFNVTARYANAVSDINDRAQASNVKFVIKYVGTDKPDEIPFIPNTGSFFGISGTSDAIRNNTIILVAFAAGLIGCAIIIVKNHKEYAKAVVAVAAVVAATTIVTGANALTIEANSFTPIANYGLYDRLVVTYHYADDSESQSIVNYGDTVALEAQEKQFHSFNGWVDQDGNPFTENTEVTRDVTLSPSFTGYNYSIAFDKNNGEGEMSSLPMEYGVAKNLTKNTFTREDYDFVGWNTIANGSGTPYADEEEISNLATVDGEVITLYAQWRERVGYLRPGMEINAIMKRMANNSQDVEYYTYDHNILGVRRVYELPELSSINYEIISTDGSIYDVYCWYDQATQEIHWYSDASRIRLNQDSSYLFSNFLNATVIDLSGMDSVGVTNMDTMFGGNESVETLNVASLDTSSVTNMHKLFKRCSSVESIDLSSWNTGNVTDMTEMFSNATSLSHITFGANWNTANVTSFKEMFTKTNLTNLNLSSWNVSSAIDMSSMFTDSNRLATLNLAGWNNANVTNVSNIFSGLTNLQSLNVSGWKNNKITSMDNLFANLQNLETLNLTNFKTDNVVSMVQMFQNCSKLSSLNLSSFNTAKVIDMNHMFNRCASLSTLDLSSFNTTNLRNMQGMIANMNTLETIDMSSFNTANVTNMSNVFKTCPSLRTIYVSDSFVTTNVSEFEATFQYSPLITGGSGTTNGEGVHSNKDYARIDNPTDGKPGLFTDIADKH